MSILIIIASIVFFMSKLKNKSVLFNNFDQTVQWFSPVVSESKDWGFDPFLILAIIDQESAGEPTIIGDSGTSFGLMQIKQPALTDVINIMGLPFIEHSELLKPENNIRYGTAYLALKRKDVDGNIYNTLRAYNQGFAGMNRTDKNQLEKGKQYAKSVITKKEALKNEFNF